jgi:hypothetical protein
MLWSLRSKLLDLTYNILWCWPIIFSCHILLYRWKHYFLVSITTKNPTTNKWALLLIWLQTDSKMNLVSINALPYYLLFDLIWYASFIRYPVSNDAPECGCFNGCSKAEMSTDGWAGVSPMWALQKWESTSQVRAAQLPVESPHWYSNIQPKRRIFYQGKSCGRY